MFNMIVGKRSHRIIRVIIIRLIPHSQSLLLSNLLSRCLEVFRQQLALFVEVVASALYPVYQYRKFRCKYPHRQLTTSTRISRGPPDHFFSNSVASCSFHFSWSSPRYPVNAFWPQGQLIGFVMGAKAETDLYFPGLRRNYFDQDLARSREMHRLSILSGVKA